MEGWQIMEMNTVLNLMRDFPDRKELPFLRWENRLSYMQLCRLKRELRECERTELIFKFEPESSESNEVYPDEYATEAQNKALVAFLRMKGYAVVSEFDVPTSKTDKQVEKGAILIQL